LLFDNLKKENQNEAKLREVTPDIVVDFTQPDAVNRNAQLYCRCETPFVMGTTGGDREVLIKTGCLQ